MQMRVPAVRIGVKSIRLACIVLTGFLLSRPAAAQFYNGSQMTFGKNRVQYNDFCGPTSGSIILMFTTTSMARNWPSMWPTMQVNTSLKSKKARNHA
ncbi:MAG: hypothetical protein U0Z17_02665 [Bacteroidales bacterium]